MVIASTSILSQVTSGNSRATSAAISSHITMRVPLRVRLGDDGEQLARARAGERERKAHDALDAGAGEHRDVGRDFLRQAAMDASADAGIFAFGVLAHDHPVEFRAADMAQRARDPRQNASRPHVGVLVERLADREPQAPQRDVIGHVGRADRAEQDGVVILDQVAAVRRHERAGLLVALRAPVEMIEAAQSKPPSRSATAFKHLDAGGESPPRRCRRRE